MISRNDLYDELLNANTRNRGLWGKDTTIELFEVSNERQLEKESHPATFREALEKANMIPGKTAF